MPKVRVWTLGALLLGLALSLPTPAAAASQCADVDRDPDWGRAFEYTATLSEGALQIDFEVAPCFHAYGPNTKSGKPLKVALRPGAGFEATGPAKYPKGTQEEGPFGPRTVIRGPGTIILPVHPTRPEAHTLKAVLQYHACTDSACGPPQQAELSIELSRG